jgi:hypothetical protein
MTTIAQDPTLTAAGADAPSSPSARAMRESKSRSDDYERAKQALFEQVRTSDGYAGSGIVDQVAAGTNIAAHVVQRALLDMVGRGELVSNDHLAITLPTERG